jgi:serine/threonine protein kinase
MASPAEEPEGEGASDSTLTHLPSSARESDPPEGTLTHTPSSRSGPALDAAAPNAEGSLTPTPSSDAGSGGATGTLTHTPSSDAGSGGSSGAGLEWLRDEARSGSLTQGLSESSASDESSRWEPGQVLAGIYRVDSLLGAGGMGAVYRVQHTEWGVDLAVKTPLPRLFANPVALQRFQREAETWIDLGLHPNVARCYYVREVEGAPRIFVEFVRGGTLKEWLATKRDPADWKTLLRLALEAADGLAFAHERGLVHRDVKPANCLLSERGTLRITDFGLVKVTGEVAAPATPGTSTAPLSSAAGPELTHFEAGMGTPEYAAPEQWSSASEVDARADVYSWGVLLWEIVTGRRPFDAPDDRQPPAVLINRHCFSELPNPRDHRLDLPTGLIELLRLCLAKEPAQRPSTIREAREILAQIYKARCGEVAPRVPPTPRVTAAVLCNRALSLRDLGQDEAARATWEEALRLEPHHPESRYNLGLLAWRAGELRDLELVEQMEAVRAVQTRTWIDELLLARVHLERGDGEAAAELLDQIPPEAQSRPLVTATRAAADARLGSVQALAAPLPRFAAHTGELVAWNKRYLLFLFDPVNRMGARPGLTVFDRDGKRRGQLDLQGEERLGRTALSGTGAAALQGEFALAACLSGSLKVWDLRQGTGAPRHELRGPGPLEFLAAKGPRAVTGARVPEASGERGEASAWDLLRGRRLGTCRHEGPVRAVALDADEAWSADATTLKIWGLEDGGLRESWELADVSGIWPCPGGAILELPEGAVRWDRASGSRRRRFSRRATARKVVGGILAEVCSDGVRLWDLERGACARTVPHPAERDAAALRAAFELHPLPSREALEASAERPPPPSLVLAAAPGEALQRVLLRHLTQPWQAPLALARVESSEAALTLQRAFRRHLQAAQQAAKGRRPARALRALGMARAVEGFARHPEALAVVAELGLQCQRSGLATIWEALRIAGDWELGPELSFSPAGELLAVADPCETGVYRVRDGTRVATCAAGGPVQFLSETRLRVGRSVFDAEGVQELELELAPGAPEPELIHHDDRLAWSAPGDALWSLVDGRALREPLAREDWRARSALSPRGDWALCQVGPRQLVVWNLARRAPLDELACGSAFRISALALDSVGRYAAVAGINADRPRVQIWDLRERRLRLNQDWPSELLDLCFLPANDLLVLSDAGGGLTLWDHLNGEEVRQLPRQDPPAERVAASPDGVHVAAAGREGVRLIYLDWTLAQSGLSEWPTDADDYLFDFCQRRRPAGKAPHSGEAALSSWLERAGRPTWGPRDLEALTLALSRAGFGGIGRDQLRDALERIREQGLPRAASSSSRFRAQAPETAGHPRSTGRSAARNTGHQATPAEEPSARRRATGSRPRPAPQSSPLKSDGGRDLGGPAGDSSSEGSDDPDLSGTVVLGRLMDKALASVNYVGRTKFPLVGVVICAVLTLVASAASRGSGLLLGLVLFGGLYALQRGKCQHAADDAVAALRELLPRALGEALPQELESWAATYEDPVVQSALQRSLPTLLHTLGGR